VASWANNSNKNFQNKNINRSFGDDEKYNDHDDNGGEEVYDGVNYDNSRAKRNNNRNISTNISTINSNNISAINSNKNNYGSISNYNRNSFANTSTNNSDYISANTVNNSWANKSNDDSPSKFNNWNNSANFITSNNNRYVLIQIVLYFNWTFDLANMKKGEEEICVHLISNWHKRRLNYRHNTNGL